jgi:hypothetical protein
MKYTYERLRSAGGVMYLTSGLHGLCVMPSIVQSATTSILPAPCVRPIWA